MKETILNTLKSIERQQRVKILYAVESGSRAWGFASADSDYDVRYVYIRPPEEYLRIDAHKDTIEGPLDETLDFSGWDIRKALSLLRKSNPSLLEWSGSPIVYRTSDEWTLISQQIPNYFDPRSNLYHYFSMASSNSKQHLQGDTVIIKKYLYVLRPILCCRWVLQNHSVPPVLFDELCKNVLPPKLMPTIEDLLHQKQLCSEAQSCRHIPTLDAFIENEFEHVQCALKDMPKQSSAGYEALNALFLQILRAVW